MPLYLVRWPWLKASLISARDEDDLLDALDQVADAEGATWSVYRGPVWLDLDLPARYRVAPKDSRAPLHPDDIVVEDVGRVRAGGLVPSVPDCDQVVEMERQVLERAFPHIHAVYQSPQLDPTVDDLRLAVTRELTRLTRAAWSRATRDRREDEIGCLARTAGAPVRQIENVLRRVKRRPSKTGPSVRGRNRRITKTRK